MIRYIISAKKSSKIKDLGKSFEIKDLANSLILNEKIFPLKSMAYAARMRQSAKTTSAKITCAARRADYSAKMTICQAIFLVKMKIIFNQIG